MHQIISNISVSPILSESVVGRFVFIESLLADALHVSCLVTLVPLLLYLLVESSRGHILHRLQSLRLFLTSLIVVESNIIHLFLSEYDSLDRVQSVFHDLVFLLTNHLRKRLGIPVSKMNLHMGTVQNITNGGEIL